MSINKFSDVMDQWMLEVEQESDTGLDVKLAAAILLIAVVKADGYIDRMEYAEVIGILSQRFNIPANEVGELLEKASDSNIIEHDLNRLTLKIRSGWPEEQRLLLLKSFWEIAIADKNIHELERSLISKLASYLNLPDTEVEKARSQAELRLQQLSDS